MTLNTRGRLRPPGLGTPVTLNGVLVCSRKWLSQRKVIRSEVDVYIWVPIAKTARNIQQGMSRLLNFVCIFAKIPLAKVFLPTCTPAPEPRCSYKSVWPQQELGGMEGEQRTVLARADKYSSC